MPNGQRYSSANAATSRAAWAVALPGQNAQPMPPDHHTWVKNGTLYDDEYFDPVCQRRQIGLFVRRTEP
jgi:hypothetical protein